MAQNNENGHRDLTPYARTRFGRMHPIMTCTNRQVGCRSRL